MVECIEYEMEEGWGQRPELYHYFDTLEEAKTFRDFRNNQITEKYSENYYWLIKIHNEDCTINSIKRNKVGDVILHLKDSPEELQNQGYRYYA